MRLSQRDNCIFYAKFCSILFAFCIFISAIRQTYLIKKENQIVKESKAEKEGSCIKEKIEFYGLAFVLGAYWNIQNIQKLGIM